MNTDIPARHDIERKITARFTGKLTWSTHRDEIDYSFSEMEKLINHLNSSHIQDEIEDRLRKRLSIEDAEVSARIRFYEGSIEWDGVLYIMNWMAATAGTIGLIDYVRKTVTSVINTAIKRNLPPPWGRLDIQTTVFVEEDTISPHALQTALQSQQLNRPNEKQVYQQYPDTQTIYQQSNKDDGIRKLLISISLINSALLGALILLVIILLTSTKL